MRAMFYGIGSRFVSCDTLRYDGEWAESNLFPATRVETPAQIQSTIFSRNSILTRKKYDRTTN